MCSGSSANKKPRHDRFVLDKTQWTWRAHYWLWEANRQVLLYSENDLAPNLRMRKTPVFAQMEDALLQGRIDGDTVTQADLAFVDTLQDLSRWRVTGAGAALIWAAGDKVGSKTILMLGRSPNESPDDYLRSCKFDAEGKFPVCWTLWERVNLPVHAEQMSVALVHNRPHLFWVDVQEVADRQGDLRIKTFFAPLRFSFKMLGGGWMTPQSLDRYEHIALAQQKADAKGI